MVDLQAKIHEFHRVHIDIGTGDGRYVYEMALTHPEELFVGIEPAISQTKEYQSKINRNRLTNCLLVQGSLDALPQELEHSANTITILLPWGSLLQKVITADSGFIGALRFLSNPKTKVDLVMLFGYSQDSEPSEVQRLGLETLTDQYMSQDYLQKLTENGISIVKCRKLSKNDLFTFPTTWSKKLKFGQDRPLYYCQGIVNPNTNPVTTS